MFITRTLKMSLLAVASLMLPQFVVAADTTSSGDLAKYVTLQTASKQSFKAYVAGPQEAKQAILLIHGWWGLNNDMKTWANEFAVAGYRVMAIDLFDGNVTHNPATAKQLIRSVKQSVANEKYTAAIKVLSKQGRKVAIMGRSYGASQAIHAARVARDKVSATIVYYPYGKLMTDAKVLKGIKAPILGHFARNDFFLTPEKVNEFAAATKNAGLVMKVNMYEARHGFDNPKSTNFDGNAHEMSLQKTQQFLAQYLN